MNTVSAYDFKPVTPHMEIRKVLLLLLLMLPALVSSAQNEFASVQLPSKTIDGYWIVPDDQGNICIQYFKKPYLYFEIYGRNGSRTIQIKEPFKYTPEIIGGTFSDGKYGFYLKPRSIKKEGDIGAFIVDANSNKLENIQHHRIRAINTEEISGYLDNGSDLFVFVQIRGNNKLKIVRLNPSQTMESRQFEVPAIISKSFASLEPTLFVDPLGPKSIYSCQLTKKAYINGRNITLTFDQKAQFKTHLWTIFWDTDNNELTSLPEEKMVFGKSSNAYLLNNWLYRWTIDDVKIDLSVYDLLSGDLIQSYKHNGEEPIPFQSGPAYLIDEYGARHSLTTMRNEKLFKTFSNGYPSIYVDRINRGNVKVTMGAFNDVATGLTIGGGFGSFGGAGGVAIGGSRQITGTRRGSTYFQTNLTYPGLEVTKTDNFLTPNDRIIRYIENKGLDPRYISAKVYQYSEDKLHLAYIDRKDFNIKILEFIR